MKKRKNFNEINFNKVKTIINEGLTNISANVTFVNLDGSKQTVSLKKQSLFNSNDKKISAKEYMSNLNSIKHDMNAKYYTVNILN